MATAKIGAITVYDVRGFPAAEQRSLMAEYHPDGVELIATEFRGGPFILRVILIETLTNYELKRNAIASFAGGAPVTIIDSIGQEADNCILGGEAPAGGVVVESLEAVTDSDGTAKVLAIIAVTGHKIV